MAERYHPGSPDWAAVSGDHLARYLFAVSFARGKRVLDAGTGYGYGAAILRASGASEVLGVDIDPAVVASARAAHSSSGLSYLADDCERLDQVPGPFDLICSFENIEHLKDPRGFLRAAARRLGPDGILVCSTPDRAATPPFVDGRPANPFHVNEWSADEFAALLGESFGRIEMLAQVRSGAAEVRRATAEGRLPDLPAGGGEPVRHALVPRGHLPGGEISPRVLHVVPAAFGEGGIFGGAERYAFELARSMADATPTRLVAFADTPGRRSVGRLDVRLLGPAWYIRGHQTNPFHPALVSHLARADVIHCHQRAVVASSFTAAIGRLTGRKVFVSDLGGGGWDVSAYTDTDPWFHGHLHLSEYSRSLAGHRGWNRAHVISGGVDVDRFSPSPAVAREPLVVFVGRLMPHKGVDYLVEALPPGLDLEVIGRPYTPAFFLRLKELAAGKPVRFRLECDDAEVVRAYRRARCVVLPSVYRTSAGSETRVPELLGQTLLEGMACGTAAVCTAVASMPEVVVEGETGLIVPPNDPPALRAALERLRDDPAEADRMGRAGRHRVLDRFTWPAVVRRCLDIYSGKAACAS
jgi:glycosyltransferase involved in cell wall biosynthesis